MIRITSRLNELLREALDSRDTSALHTFLERYPVDAVTGPTDGSVFGVPGCTPELARWMAGRGAAVDQVDRFGKTALHAIAQRPPGRLRVEHLIELGAAVDARSTTKETPLHGAVGKRRVEATRALLKHGADVAAKNMRGDTPVVACFSRLQFEDCAPVAAISALLVDAGAILEPDARRAVETLRDRMEPLTEVQADSANAAGLSALCRHVGLDAPKRTWKHDGTSPIVATGVGWLEQHDELWHALVPTGGPCDTVQGEVIRITGKMGSELNRNAGMNWDADFDRMGAALCDHLASGTALPDTDVARARRQAARLPDDLDGWRVLAELATLWVAHNPEPVRLASPPYGR